MNLPHRRRSATLLLAATLLAPLAAPAVAFAADPAREAEAVVSAARRTLGRTRRHASIQGGSTDPVR